MNRAGRGFWGRGALEFLSFLCARANSIGGHLSKSMGVASLNTKAMLSMCFYLCPIFSVVFLFVFFFCYNVIHLRWMTVFAHLWSLPGRSHLIRFSPRYNDPCADILLFPIAVVHLRASFGPSYIPIPYPSLVRCLGSHRIPCPSHSSHSPPFADAP